MNAGRLSAGLLGILGVLLLGGLALGGAAAAPVTIPHALMGKVPGPASCLAGTTLLVSPSVVPAGRLVEVQTVSPALAHSPCAGQASYVYQGLPPGCPSVSAAQLSCVPLSTGSYTLVVTVHAGMAVAVAHTTLLVL